ncbi:LodA/GoxA family CTQ-dependent oxidase [Ideonella sp. 4Y11]|uniref:LodA/GoxA family CTQ-dependent oxidase n=1 Tax=Ideonella aquatica TaxID=2824119 RepID=A0A940YLX7_9BURK|nr:LodA/GoxA family CTQ-dependent oxidase [Ideonella aquatica]MBQ0960319.1 LodA/GoxA family CTQ-dependent oxidase [Ideonella aquatica]
MRSLQDDHPSFTATCACDDPVACLGHMFVDMTAKRRVAQGQCPARRPVFLRTHGILQGRLTFSDDIPAPIRHGLFAHPGRSHPVYVRYSSDLSDGRPDWESTIGVGIKLFDVPGDKVVSDDGAGTADLLLQNVPFFFVDNARQMCEFTKASFEGWGDEWVQRHAPDTNALLDRMAKPIRSVLATNLWSVVPFRLGSGFCKYMLVPGTSTFPGDPDTDDPHFLAADLRARMARGPATLDLYVQVRPDAASFGEAYLDEHFPLDRATVVWDDKLAPPVRVATIALPQQDVAEPAQAIYGDWLAFNIGRVPAVNAPVGSIAQARMQVYLLSADFRRTQNGQPTTEPSAPGEPQVSNPACPFPHHPSQPQAQALSAEQIARITQVRIHPGIGVARVGNSASDFYVGPETTAPAPTAWGQTRDAGGALKRQAARFRVYGYDQNGNVVAEIQQSANSRIEWSVHVANRKAQWYEFNAAMDLPATCNISVPQRNPTAQGAARDALCIDAGVKKITGIGMNDASFALTGTFQGTSVYLGELRTDSVGRLLVLPGMGVSASPGNTPVYDPAHPGSFNNAAGWYDDIADGPVHARVTIGDRDFDADPAWVLSAPPSFAPDLTSWRTLDDLLRAVWAKAGMLSLPQRVSFQDHVRPALERLTDLQWVNKGFSSMFGADGPMNFRDPALMRKLSFLPPSSLYPDPYAELRRTIFNSFRAVVGDEQDIGAWPWSYGDTFGYTDPTEADAVNAQTYLRLPDYYGYILTAWVQGHFVSDYRPEVSQGIPLDDWPLQERPDMLDRAAMHFCLADAFHPGCELTWPVRHASLFRAPYRIRERQPGLAEPSYGPQLTQDDVLRMGGPLYDQGPGDLTRWMAVPWQGDTAYCRSGYDMEFDPYLPTYWPARVPNQVLTLTDYQTLCDRSKPMDERIAAFHNRPAWLRQLPSANPAPEQMVYMIEHFSEMGVLEARPRPDDLDWLPAMLYVENLTAVKEAELASAHRAFTERYALLGPHDRLLAEAGWFSDEQRNEFATIKLRSL